MQQKCNFEQIIRRRFEKKEEKVPMQFLILLSQKKIFLKMNYKNRRNKNEKGIIFGTKKKQEENK